MTDHFPVPESVVQAIEEYVDKELHDAEKFENRKPLDDSGVFSLHRLAARLYAMGFDAGERVQAERSRAQARRKPGGIMTEHQPRGRNP